MAIQIQLNRKLNRKPFALSQVSLKAFYTFLIVFNISLFSVLYFLFPALRGALINEDEFLENLTTIFCIDVFLLGTCFIAGLRQKRYWKVYCVIPVLGLFAALDELSFGERLFQFEVLRVAHFRLDALHDVFEIVVKLSILAWNRMPKRQNYVLFAVVGAIACLLLFGLYWVVRHRQQVAVMTRQGLAHFSSLIKRHPPLDFLFLAIVFAVVTLIMDLGFSQSDFMSFIEELLELNAALTLLFASFAIRRSPGMRSAHP